MADFNDRPDLNSDISRSTFSGNRDWQNERQWWESNYHNRPYVRADRGFDYYEPGYRYGTDAAQQYSGRNWNEIEHDLRRDWDTYEHRSRSTWDEIKDSVRDAWDRLTGNDDFRTSRR